jgi:hypothetical protein
VSRTGAGGIRSCCRTRRMVEAPTRWPILSNSPWILLSPQAGILPAQALDQLGHGVGDGRASDAMRICPFPGNQVTMPAQDCARCDQAMPPQHSAATCGRERRGSLDPPSPSEAWDSLCARRQLRGAAPGARRPWTPTSGRTTTAGSVAAERPGKADATTRVTIMPRRLTTPTSLVSGPSRLLEPLTV